MSDLYIETRLQAIKDIASASCADIKDADNIASFCDEIYSAIPKIDKIVEELKQQAEQYRHRAFEVEKKGLSALADKYYGKQCSYEHAIEIVKQDGVSDDVCEWKYIGIPNITPYKTACGYKGAYDNRYKYCPYCSKKIKVVE